jgi:hypothetical protein
MGDELDDQSEHGEEAHDARKIEALGPHGAQSLQGSTESALRSVPLLDGAVSSL